MVSKKSVSIDAENYTSGGYVFVAEGLNVGHQAIAFKIAGNSSGIISVGMGLTDIIKSKQYLINGKSSL